MKWEIIKNHILLKDGEYDGVYILIQSNDVVCNNLDVKLNAAGVL